MSAVEFDRSWSGSMSDGLMDAIETEMSQLGQIRGEALITKTIDHKGISDRGDLRKSVTTWTNQEPGRIELEVGPDAEHAKYVFFGTRPHRAPFDPIKEWARRKLGDEDAWWPVWLKIEREGTDPQDFLTGPGRVMADEAPDRVEDAVSDHLEGE